MLCPRVEFNERKQLQSPQCSYRCRRCSAPDEFCVPFDLSPTLVELISELQAIRSILFSPYGQRHFLEPITCEADTILEKVSKLQYPENGKMSGCLPFDSWKVIAA